MKYVMAAAVALAVSVPALADRPAPTPAAAHFEVKFMTDMIDHHMMAVMMSQHCVEKAVREELRTMCQEIIAAQTKEIQQMQTWLKDWYGISYEPDDMQMTGQMKKLMAMSGATFEIEFMQMMIKHHFQAIKEAQQCQRKAYHPELLQLCQNIESTQAREIQQMQTWLCAWYGICNWGPKAEDFTPSP
jgi:uncharacterized protein (DUF305 family)